MIEIMGSLILIITLHLPMIEIMGLVLFILILLDEHTFSLHTFSLLHSPWIHSWGKGHGFRGGIVLLQHQFNESGLTI